MSIPVSSKREFFSTPNTISVEMSRNTQLRIDISAVWKSSVMGESIQLFFNATHLWETNRTTRYVVIIYIMGGAARMFGFGIFRGMKLVPRISVVHNFFGGQSVRARIIFNIKMTWIGECTCTIFFPMAPLARVVFSAVFAVYNFFWEELPIPRINKNKWW